MSIASYVSDETTKTDLRPSPRAIKRAALALAAALGIAAAGDFGYGYITTGRYLESTDDAYVKADSTIIAPKVSGYIAQVLVTDNQPVKAGQLLARIDDRDYRAALNQAKADVAAAEASVCNIDAQLALQQPVIEQGKADVTAAEANLKFAQEERARYDDLMKTGSGTVQRAQQTDAALRSSTAQLQGAKSGLAAAERKVDVLSTQRAQAMAQVDRARAVEQQAELNLSYTQITAPVDGTVGARTLRVGQYVQAGTQLMAVVPLDAVYVVANFKETQLTHVRNGQPVELTIDSFRNTTLKGHVDSLSPASGLEFALLPPDNATGNFTKIVQRVPVKIVLDDNKLAGLLRPGMSAIPTVNTKATVLAEREARNHLAAAARGNGG
ncbi:HlyD family secretion protein [Bradyrhizobium sp. ISRA443]|uniref:HlyD family secretion protein n=1 Tax=unclassified Bradyrhizobium TaxID=2631580 RepID=UPI0024788599|nr:MULTISPECIES: HlyD family secretion protein [unclassified Bradyrhizobium]WGR95448.1 HlyD family secretion protein [Bradyrhizobium sp. ISRA435]WGS00465.1 HlyD family secretion protein [Bradyrhizobium sp. ISRA436]WGS07354.1 HlyD family secretion protein [Bradyrhizobium sp. ISRA437]WGS14238.1 HlyD family secretion protein [Bradyrhizobium sp. ISRA443]